MAIGTAIYLATSVATMLPVTGVVAQATTSRASPLKSVEVRFTPGAPGREGYAEASVTVEYGFLVCDGELHIAYSLNPISLKLSSFYALDQTGAQVKVEPPTVSAIHLSGSVSSDGRILGIGFSDKFAGKALGYGCFTGQTKKLGLMKEFVRPDATPAQIATFLDSLSISALSETVLTSATAKQAVIDAKAKSAIGNSNYAERQPLIAGKRGPMDVQPVDASQASQLNKSANNDPETQNSQLADETNDHYMVCLMWGRAYSPIYLITGNIDELDNWVSANYPSYNTPRWLASIYTFGAVYSGTDSIKYNTKSSCSIDNLESIRQRQRAFKAGADKSPILMPWVIPSNFPAPAVSFSKVE